MQSSMHSPENSTVLVDILSQKKCILSNIPPSAHAALSQVPSVSFSPRTRTYLAAPTDLNFIRRSLADLQLSIQSIPNQIIQLFCCLNRPPLKKIERFPEKLGPWVLWPHQIDALGSFGRRGGQIVLDDAWNTGKTVTSIAVMHCYKFQKVVVACSESLFFHWKLHLLQSKIWTEQEIHICLNSDQQSLRNKKFKGCFLLTGTQLQGLKIDKKLIDCLIVDEPALTEWQGQSLKSFRNFVLLCREGQSKLWRLLPLLIPSLSEEFLQERYKLMSVGIASKHSRQYNQLKQLLVYTGCTQTVGISFCKAVPLLIQALPDKVDASILKAAFINYIGRVVSYIQFLQRAYSQKVLVLYRQIEIAKRLEEHFGTTIKMLPYQQCTDIKPHNGTLILLQPFLKHQEKNARMVYLRAASSANRIEYFRLISPEGELPDLLYPDLLNQQEIRALRRKRSRIPKSITVYFDIDDSEKREIEIQDSTLEEKISEDAQPSKQADPLEQPLCKQSRKSSIEAIDISSQGSIPIAKQKYQTIEPADIDPVVITIDEDCPEEVRQKQPIQLIVQNQTLHQSHYQIPAQLAFQHPVQIAIHSREVFEGPSSSDIGEKELQLTFSHSFQIYKPDSSKSKIKQDSSSVPRQLITVLGIIK